MPPTSTVMTTKVHITTLFLTVGDFESTFWRIAPFKMVEEIIRNLEFEWLVFVDGAPHYGLRDKFTVYPKKYAHGFVVLCFVGVMQSFIMNSHEVFIHIHQGCFAGTGVIVRLPQCQWSKPDGYGKISQRITTTKHSKAKTVCIFLGIYCSIHNLTVSLQMVWFEIMKIWRSLTFVGCFKSVPNIKILIFTAISLKMFIKQ